MNLKSVYEQSFDKKTIIELNFREIFEFGNFQESLKVKTNFEIEFKINLNNYISLTIVAINSCQAQL